MRPLNLIMSAFGPYAGEETIDFEKLLEHATSRKTLYTESTFWFDIHYLVFGLLLLATALLIANVFWKRKLMKEEQALIGHGKEALA